MSDPKPPSRKPSPQKKSPSPAETRTPGTGEGAESALKVLINNRPRPPAGPADVPEEDPKQ